MKITCGRAEGGTVEYGTLIEIGMPDEQNSAPASDPLDGRDVVLSVDGKEYAAKLVSVK